MLAEQQADISRAAQGDKEGQQQGGVADSSCCRALDHELLRFALPRLVATWQYWNSGQKAVCVRSADSLEQAVATGSGLSRPGVTPQEHPHQGQGVRSDQEEHWLSRYYAEWEEPRPESYR